MSDAKKEIITSMNYSNTDNIIGYRIAEEELKARRGLIIMEKK